MNLWVIPVILSIGMTNAIIIIQRWKQERNLDIVYRSTGKTILITMVTIFVMVFPFCFSKHSDLTSMAYFLMAGIVCSFLALLFILPPLLVNISSKNA